MTSWRLEWRPGLMEDRPLAGWSLHDEALSARDEAVAILQREPTCRLRLVQREKEGAAEFDVAEAFPCAQTLRDWKSERSPLPDSSPRSGQMHFDATLERETRRLAAFRRIVRRMMADGLMDEGAGSRAISAANYDFGRRRRMREEDVSG